MNVWRGSELVSGKPTLPYPKIESGLLVLYKESSVAGGNTSTHTRLRYTAHEEVCVCVCVCEYAVITNKPEKW
jgi:hypothetical protein